MKVIGIEGYGEPFKELNFEIPKINDNQVLVKTKAISINPIDWKAAAGEVKSIANLSFPTSVNKDFSGIIIKVGKNVTEYKVGDRVAGLSMFEAAAEYIAADPKLIGLLPDSISFIKGAALPLAGMTAWNGIYNFAHVMPNDVVFFPAGSGGLGIYAIQILNSIGAYTITTSSAKNFKLLTALGANKIIDYHKENVTDVLSNVDIVFDTLGGKTVDDDFKVLKENGCLVSVLNAKPNSISKEKNIRVIDEWLFNSNIDMQNLFDEVALGKIKVIIDKIFPFSVSGMNDAINLSKTHHAVGKIVLSLE